MLSTGEDQFCCFVLKNSLSQTQASEVKTEEVSTVIGLNEGGISFRQTARPLDQNNERARHLPKISQQGQERQRRVRQAEPEAGRRVHTRPRLGEGRLGRQSQWAHGYLLIVLQLVVQDHTVGLVWLGPRQGDAVHSAAHLVHDGHGRWCCKRGQRSGVKAGMRKYNLF
jgi:hypothetical protein